MTKTKKRAKRKPCKPVRLWAVVSKDDPNLSCGWLFRARKACAPLGRERIVRVEIREVRR